MIKNRFVLIDAFALIFRAYYALPPSLTKDGHSVNAVYGFASALLGAIKTLGPEYLAVGMDLPAPTHRHKEYVEYKAHRAPMPEDLGPQIPYVKELLKVMNIPTYAVEGYEGEDVVASIITKAKKQNEKVKNMEYIIVTGDMDLLQLIDEQTKVYSMARGINQAAIYDEKKVVARYGLTPAQFVDFKALKGDTSDNIPGVPGIGEKTAAKLIVEYGNLEKIYENLEKIHGKVQTLLKDNKEQAYLSQKLSTIQNDVELEFKLEDAKIHEYNKQDVIKLFNHFGFKSLIVRLPEEKKKLEQGKLL
ncbi:MAG: 5'-3' exonuclease H3TH domain-containing protein [Patescibacteria group bacterium]|jgi:DNA polymerase-1